MYIPRFNQQTDINSLHNLIQSHPLATWIIMHERKLLVNHIPFLLDPESGEKGTLFAHIARANELFQLLKTNPVATESVLVFSGLQTYISPSWYPSKQDDGKVVPTWNYSVVHARGIPTLEENPDWILEHVKQLTDLHESKRAGSNQPAWSVNDAPSDYIDMKLKGIVGVKLPIQSLEGKWKLGQNRPKKDRDSLQEHYGSHALDELAEGL